MGQSRLHDPAVLHFCRANFALATLIVAVLALGDDVRTWVFSHLWYFAAALVVLEALTITVLWLLYRNPDLEFEESPFGDEVLKRDRLDIRFGIPDDFPATEAVYREWFRPQLSIDDADYVAILRKGPFVRVAEATFSNGTEESKRIVGYYSVWPMARDIYKKLANGTMKERELTVDMILEFNDPRATVLYLPEICASKKWDVGGPLLRDLLRYVTKILDQHTQIETVGAWPYTKYGRKLIETYRFKPSKLRGLFGKFHEISRSLALALPRPRTPFSDNWSITY